MKTPAGTLAQRNRERKITPPSKLERKFIALWERRADILLQHGWLHDEIPLLACEREWYFHPSRRWKFDFAWPEALVALEIDGGMTYRRIGSRLYVVPSGHASPEGRRQDIEKSNAALALGWLVFRATSTMLTGRAAEQLVLMLAAVYRARVRYENYYFCNDLTAEEYRQYALPY